MTDTEATTRGTEWLAGAGLRPTRQRVALATLLVGDGQHRHVTAESLFAAVCENGDSVSLATVYNTLRAFCDVGLLQEVTVDGSKAISTPTPTITRISSGRTTSAFPTRPPTSLRSPACPARRKAPKSPRSTW